MSAKLDLLCRQLTETFDGRLAEPSQVLNEVTATVAAEHYLSIVRQLRDDPLFAFEQLIDLSGIDYSEYPNPSGKRFAAVLQLLSLTHNRRLRLQVFAPDDDFPVLPSVVSVWNGANWYEREAFDFYGILFAGHDDLRRILTDYGFVGHPFRKDFPVSGYVEMRYDAEKQRVVYQPVTIEPREVTPRIVREKNFGKVGDRG